MKKFKSLFLIILITAFSAACSESFLDLEQRGATQEENFYNTDEEAMEALMAVFDNLQQIHYTLCTVLDALSDEAYAGGGQRGDNGGMLEELNEFRFGPTNSTITALFDWSYTGIYRANKVINKVNPDTELKNIAVAEAKFIRAFHYFYLVTLWGDVPLVLFELENDRYAQPRIDKSFIWKQIEKDLLAAAEGLPLRTDMPEEFSCLAARGAAHAFLGKVYLFQKKFGEAAYYLDLAINSLQYDLYPDYHRVLRPDSEFGSESLFEISYGTGKNYLYFPGSESSGWLYFTSPREAYFESGSLEIYPGWGFLNPKQSLYDAYIEAGDTVRRTATLITEADLIGHGGRLRNVFNDLPYGNDGIVRLKYVLYQDDGGLPNPKANNGTNIRMLRFADVLLMAAEANNRKTAPDDDKALLYLNRVRERAGLEPLPLEGDELFEAVKRERLLELSFEFVRFQDLIRWGEAYTVLKYQGRQIPVGNGEFISIPEAGFKQGKNELLPVPEQEMNVNKYMEQNPGYN